MIKKINHIAEKFPIFQKYDKNCQRSKNEARFQLSDPKWPSYLGRKKIVMQNGVSLITGEES